MSSSRNVNLEYSSISDLVDALISHLSDWPTKELERLSDMVEFELMDRVNRVTKEEFEAWEELNEDQDGYALWNDSDEVE